MGSTHCAFDDFIEEKNTWKDVLCTGHEVTHGNLCCMYDCKRPKVPSSHACAIHQNNWHWHAIRYGWQSLLGIC
jgi:hypothetical protein